MFVLACSTLIPKAYTLSPVPQTNGAFPALGVPYWGPHYKGILLFGDLPYFLKPTNAPSEHPTVPCWGSLLEGDPNLCGGSPIFVNPLIGILSIRGFYYLGKAPNRPSVLGYLIGPYYVGNPQIDHLNRYLIGALI